MTRHLLAEWGMAAFLAIMAGMNLWNCWLLWREKQVKGISPLTVLVRSGANVWQAWFLFQLGQWAAFSAAMPATMLNLAWVLMALYYQRWPRGASAAQTNDHSALLAGDPCADLVESVRPPGGSGPLSRGDHHGPLSCRSARGASFGSAVLPSRNSTTTEQLLAAHSGPITSCGRSPR
jgi:hypothetical protein